MPIFGLSRLINLFEKTLRDGGIGLSLRIELNCAFLPLLLTVLVCGVLGESRFLHLTGLFVDFCT